MSARAAIVGMQRLAGLVVLAMLASPGGALAQDDGFTFEIMEPEVKDESQARLDSARDAMRQERYSEALLKFDEIIADEKLKAFHADAQYEAAKALYRMGLNHAALKRYVVILDAGPAHPYFTKSRDWLFFIARRMDDRLVVIELIARYTKPEDLPESQRNEFNYQLARYYFDLSLNAGAQGVSVGPSTDAAPAEETEKGPGDVFDFGEEGIDDGAGEGTEEPTEESPDDDFDFSEADLGGGDDDGFDFDFGDDSKPAPKKAKPKKKPKTKPKAADTPAGAAGAADAGSGKGDANTGSAPASVPDETPPPVETEHKNENPASAEEALKRALSHAALIKEDFPLYAKAVYLKGLIHYALGEFDPAVEAFRVVVRMTHPKTGTEKNLKLREMAFFSLARIHYQFEQFRYAIFYYQRIDRDSEAWLDSLFEASWAHYRLGEYEKALGNLVSIQSPFFIDEYYPESHILKAITFYENCRYPESRAFLTEFKAKYDGVIVELDRLLEQERTPEEFYQELTTLQSKVADGADDDARSLAITARILRFVLRDKRIAQYKAALVEVEQELVRVTGLSAPYGGTDGANALVESLTTRRGDLIKALGSLLRQKLEQERQFLKDLAAKLIRIQFEIAKQEKESLEAELRGESQAVPIADYKFTTATDDERVYWPFIGEYWRDELGTYEYTLTRGCRPPADG
jgi:tetratricopeptide (TPR) repeat protein